MIWKVIQLFISAGLVAGGLSGKLVLRGTDSSAALVAVGALWLIFDVIQLVSFSNKTDRVQQKKQRKGRSPLFFILCGIYALTNLICAFMLFDELNVSSGRVMEIFALCGILVSIIGIILLLAKKPFGITVALAGSAILIAFTILSGVFIYGSPTPYFHLDEFVLFMLMGLMPGFVLWFQMKLGKHRTTGKNEED